MVGQLVRGQGGFEPRASVHPVLASPRLWGCPGSIPRFCLFLNLILTECVSASLNLSTSPAPICAGETGSGFRSLEAHPPLTWPTTPPWPPWATSLTVSWVGVSKSAEKTCRPMLHTLQVLSAPKPRGQLNAQRSRQRAWAAGPELGEMQITRSWRPAWALGGLQLPVTGSRQPWAASWCPAPLWQTPLVCKPVKGGDSLSCSWAQGLVLNMPLIPRENPIPVTAPSWPVSPLGAQCLGRWLLLPSAWPRVNLSLQAWL